jgi:hypothetical protein
MQRGGKMKIAVMTGLPAKWYVNINASQVFCDLMNNLATCRSLPGYR